LLKWISFSEARGAEFGEDCSAIKKPVRKFLIRTIFLPVETFKEVRMMNPLKLGIAVACLLGVALLIVVDMSRAHTGDAGPAAPLSPVTPPPSAGTAFPAPIPAASNEVHVGPTITTQPGVTIENKAVGASPAALESSNAGIAKKSEGTSVALASAKNQGLESVPAQVAAYTVAQGDTLYGISVKIFGTPRYYERIFDENRDRISDPNTLQIGLNLRIPEVPAKTAAGVPGVKGKDPAPVSPAATPLPAEAASKDLR